MSEIIKTKSYGETYNFNIKDHFPTTLQWQEDFTLYFILKGDINVSLNSRGHLFNEKDIFFLEPFNAFSVITHSVDLRVLELVISRDFIQNAVQDFNLIDYKLRYIRFQNNTKEHTHISRSLSEIVLYSLKGGSLKNLKCIQALTSILFTLIETYGIKGTNNKESKNDYTKERINQIISFLNKHYSEKVSLDDMANHLNIHPQYFSSYFKKTFGRTFIEYLNGYRINRSIPSLLNSHETILTIALANGFSNHKTYSSTFKKLFNLSPTQYRQKYAHDLSPQSYEHEMTTGLFYYFQQFWNQDDYVDSSSNNIQDHMSLDIDLTIHHDESFYNKQPLFLDAGRASSCLRSEIQEQIRHAKHDLNFDYLHMRDIFSDDLFVYHEGIDKSPMFNWQYTDIIIDFLISINVKPFFELGFMPRDLASKKQYAGWNFHPNISFPKSLDKWTLLISTFMRHYIERYGHTEVASWYFDFWVCPDLRIPQGYWHESMEDFFQFYLASYKAIKSVSPDLQIGSPTFSYTYGLDWYENFFSFVRDNNIEPAFISTHVYGSEIITDSNIFISNLPSQDFKHQLVEKDYILSQIHTIKDLMKKNELGDIPIIVSNWNISYVPVDLSRDTSFMGPYFAYVHMITLKEVYGMCFRSLSDVNEDFFPHSKLFHGGTGMIDFYGIKKSVYYAYFFFTRLGKQIIQVGDNYIVAKSDKGYQILFFHLSYYDRLYLSSDQSALSYEQRYRIYEMSEQLNIHLILTINPGTYSIKNSVLNRNSGSAFDLWIKMGAPKKLDSSVIHYIKNKSIPDITYTTEDVNGNLIIDALLEPHEVRFIEIEMVL